MSLNNMSLNNMSLNKLKIRNVIYVSRETNP